MSDLLTEVEAAALLKVRVETLRYWRKHNRGPRSVRMGRAVRYRAADLAAYVEACVQSPSVSESRVIS